MEAGLGRPHLQTDRQTDRQADTLRSLVFTLHYKQHHKAQLHIEQAMQQVDRWQDLARAKGLSAADNTHSNYRTYLIMSVTEGTYCHLRA